MTELAQEIVPVNIEDELKQSYLDYAMSVIVGRALPDVRDGLKPVHRRVLFAMSELGNDWNKPYKKSARVVGDVIGKYHPHGDSAVYDTIVRMAQPFSLRYPLIDGQGNFGSLDGDPPAAMRYTEVRMARIAHEMLADLEKETVDFVPNYDDTEQIPAVLPARIPNLLINGASGIAVGMATNIPPHNLTEVIDACVALLDDPDLSADDLFEYIPGPDFPTGAIISGRAGIVHAYRSGRGRIYVRARARIEQDAKGRETIIVSEIPYQVNKARLIRNIADLVKERKLEGISELRDESDKDGLRVVIEIRRDANGEVVLNNLFAQTQLETVFGINIVALVDGQPRLLNLKDMLEAFIRHRRQVVTRRTVFELRKARERGHVLEGLAIALANIDAVIAMIKESANPQEARERLVATPWAPGDVSGMLERAGEDACKPEDIGPEFGLVDGSYRLSPRQAQAILDLKLHRLTGLEHEKLLAEYTQTLDNIAELGRILASPERLLQVIRDEFAAVREQFGDERRTEIIESRRDLRDEDLIPEQEVVITVSHAGYAKSQPLDAYQAQRRGGRGKSASSLREEDYIENVLVVNTHTTILCFSDMGKVYHLRGFEIPQAGRNSRGRPLVNILSLDEGERITAILPVDDFAQGGFVFMATERGTVKKTPLEQFSRPRSAGLRALELDEGDNLVGAKLTDGYSDVVLVSSAGKAVRFKESEVRAMGRTARGVRGIRMAPGVRVISLLMPVDGDEILTASVRGFGKRTVLEEFPLHGRGIQGVKAMKVSSRNGDLVGALAVRPEDEIMLITDQGTLVRTRVREVSSLGRDTQGVMLIRLQEGESLVSIARVGEPNGDSEGEGNAGAEVASGETGGEGVADVNPPGPAEE